MYMHYIQFSTLCRGHPVVHTIDDLTVGRLNLVQGARATIPAGKHCLELHAIDWNEVYKNYIFYSQYTLATMCALIYY